MFVTVELVNLHSKAVPFLSGFFGYFLRVSLALKQFFSGIITHGMVIVILHHPTPLIFHVFQLSISYIATVYDLFFFRYSVRGDASQVKNLCVVAYSWIGASSSFRLLFFLFRMYFYSTFPFI